MTEQSEKTEKGEKSPKRCGLVAVLGETNAGKSTLVNALVGQKVSIVSRKAQTTVDRILGIAIHGNSQIILIDTPGFTSRAIDRGAASGSGSSEKTAWNAFREAEHILFVVDVNKRDKDRSFALLRKIDEAKKVSLVMNKVDLIHKPKLLEIAKDFSEVRNFERVFMVSALTGSGVNDIKKYLADVVEVGDWMFSEDDVTDLSFEKFTAEITREHIYHRVHEEVPYKCRVVTEFCESKKDGSIAIIQNIFVKNAAHKSIMLGHEGGKIKAIGEGARRELCELLEKEVHLHLNVVVENH